MVFAGIVKFSPICNKWIGKGREYFSVAGPLSPRNGGFAGPCSRREGWRAAVPPVGRASRPVRRKMRTESRSIARLSASFA